MRAGRPANGKEGEVLRAFVWRVLEVKGRRSRVLQVGRSSYPQGRRSLFRCCTRLPHGGQLTPWCGASLPHFPVSSAGREKTNAVEMANGEERR